MSKENKRNREQLRTRTNKGEVLDTTPVELPAGTRKLPSVAQEIQAQIAMQIAKNKRG